MIDGELTRLPPAPYVVPGRVELQLIGPGQDLLYQVTTDYHRKDKRYHRLWFHVRVPVAPQAGSTVRLLHRPKGLHPVAKTVAQVTASPPSLACRIGETP